MMRRDDQRRRSRSRSRPAQGATATLEAVRGHRLRGRAAARSSACSAPTAPARRRRSRSSRATASAAAASVAVLGHDPQRAAARAARARRDRASVQRHLPPPDRARGGRALGAASTRAPRDVDEVIALVGLEAGGGRAHAHALGRPAAAARLRARAGRRSRADLPRRADDRLRPAPRAAARGTTIRSLRTLGKTVLLTTHYLDEAQALADRVAIVKDGAHPRRGRAGRAGRRRGARATASPGATPAASCSSARPTTRRRCCTSSPAPRWRAASGCEDLSVTRPTLEDVYLELTAERTPEAATPAAPDAPGAVAWRQYRLERRMFWRNPSAAFFNFLLPLLFLALFGAIFAGSQERPRRDRARASPAWRCMATTFSALAHEPRRSCASRASSSASAARRCRRRRLPRGDRRQRGHQHGAPDRPDHVAGTLRLRARLAAGLARAGRVRRARRRLLRLARASRSRTRSRTSTPRRPTSNAVVPAGDLHLRRLLRRRQRARRSCARSPRRCRSST